MFFRLFCLLFFCLFFVLLSFIFCYLSYLILYDLCFFLSFCLSFFLSSLFSGFLSLALLAFISLVLSFFLFFSFLLFYFHSFYVLSFFLSFFLNSSFFFFPFFFLLSFLRSPCVLPSSIGSLSRSLDGECLRNAYGELTESLRKTSSYLSKPCFLFSHPPQQLTSCLTQDCHAKFLTPAYGEPYGPLRQVLCLRRLTAHLTDPYGFPNANAFSTMVLLTAAYGARYGPLRFSQREFVYCVFERGVILSL